MNWALKIAALLERSPAYAIFPGNKDQWKEKIFHEALAKSPELFPELDEISRAAAGFDIPPFVEELDALCFRRSPQLVHPLSAQVLNLDLPMEMNADAVLTHVAETIAGIKQESGGDAERLFLALWRLLSERLGKQDPTGIGPWWDLLPADPRIPSHTIWEHGSAKSALAGAWPDPALMLFTIASAQEVVTTARRTQDAWVGSFLMSYLTWHAIRIIAETCGPDALIYPSLKGQPLVDLWLEREKNVRVRSNGGQDASTSRALRQSLEIGSFSNLFTAIVPASQAEALCSAAKEAIRNCWREIAGSVKMAVEDSSRNTLGRDISSWEPVWKRQTDQFVDSLGIFWVVCPWGKDPWEALHAAKRFAAGKETSEFLKDFESLLASAERKGLSIGMAYPILSGFAGRALTARKNLRDFAPVKEPGFRCSLCGRWEALHPDAGEKNGEKSLNEFWKELSQIDRRGGEQKLQGRIRKGDRLCSACLTRRLAMECYFEDALGLDHHLFPSTAGIATTPFRGKMLKEAAKGDSALRRALEDYVEAFEDLRREVTLPYPAASTEYLDERVKDCGELGKKFLRMDGAWLYRGSFEEPELAGEVKTQVLMRCRESLGDVLALAKARKLGSPPGYYAILSMDADHMGDWITSKKAPWLRWLLHPEIPDDDFVRKETPRGFKRPLGPGLQIALSDSLKNFSTLCTRKTIESHYGGKLIYAGGDDLLAFVPLEHLFPVMRELYTRFRGEKNGFEVLEDGRILRLCGGKKQEGDEDHEGITVSMGVVVAHHSHPLYDAMQQAQQVLKDGAKKKLGRDAFDIRLIRRSGGHTEAGFNYYSGKGSGLCDVVTTLESLLKMIQTGRLSGRLPYRMGQCPWAYLDGEATDPESERIRGARRAELQRLVKRHRMGKGGNSDSPDPLVLVLELFDAIEGPFQKTSERSMAETTDAWQTMADLLMILRFMAQGEA